MNKFCILSIILGIILFFILYFIILAEFDIEYKYIYKYITYNNLKSTIKSGDLLLFSYLQYQYITRSVGHPAFSHMAIVIKYNDQLYSLELVGGEILYPYTIPKIGLIFHPLEDRIKYYNGYVYHASLLNPLSLEKEKELYKYINKPYKIASNPVTFLFSLFTNPKSYNKVCSQFILHILENLNIINKINPYKFWNYNRKLVKLCNDKIYSQPIQIISDDLLINNVEYRTPISMN